MKLYHKLIFIFFLSFIISAKANPHSNEDGNYSRCQQVREAVVRPVLSHLLIDNPVMEDLLVGIAATESMAGKYLKQFNGPARGIMQIEETTYNWLIDSGKVSGLVLSLGENFNDIQNNHFYSVGIASSLLYWRMDNYPLPEKDYSNHEEYMEYLTELGEYWKRFYNTHLGKGTVNKFKSRWFENGCYYQSSVFID